MRSVQYLTAEQIKLTTCQNVSGALSESNVLSPEVTRLIIEHIGRNLVFKLEAGVLAMPKQHLSLHYKWPKDWWQAFKERWFPARLQKWFPVEYDTVDVEQPIYGPICPHMAAKESRLHFQFLAEGEG